MWLSIIKGRVMRIFVSMYDGCLYCKWLGKYETGKSLGIVDSIVIPKEMWKMARYNQPLFLAVKMNRKVLNVGDTTIVDTYIVK